MYLSCLVHFRFCQACGHMGATLFRIADLVASGAIQFPDDPACTEKLAEWTDPKGQLRKQLYRKLP